MGEFHESNCFMQKVTVTLSTLIVKLFVGMGVYSNLSKFQSDSAYS